MVRLKVKVDKHYNLGKIVGITTKGKGTIQTLVSLPVNDESGIKLTVREFFSPNGGKIDGVGVEPHYHISNSSNEYDLQLIKALELVNI